MATKTFDLHEHLKYEHRISPFQTYLKEIVYGGADGIITTFAVVAGFTGAQAGASIPAYPVLTVLLFGLANLFADAASMGLSNFLSLRSEQDVYKAAMAKERYEIDHNEASEREETMQILKQKGFNNEQAKTLTSIYATNKNYWLSFMMNDELELANPLSEKPKLTALATFSAFIIFGFIPLIPYIINPSPNSFIHATIAAFTALFLLGVIRFKVTNESIFRSVFEIILVGSVAATIAYVVGTFFKV